MMAVHWSICFVFVLRRGGGEEQGEKREKEKGRLAESPISGFREFMMISVPDIPTSRRKTLLPTPCLFLLNHRVVKVEADG